MSGIFFLTDVKRIAKFLLGEKKQIQTIAMRVKRPHNCPRSLRKNKNDHQNDTDYQLGAGAQRTGNTKTAPKKRN